MSTPASAARRFLIVSDLHLTSGRNAVTGQWSTTEDFFWDAEFSEFLAYHTDATPTTLIINGDLVDFMQILDSPTPAERAAFDISAAEIDHGGDLRCTEHAAEFQMDKVLEGHAALFEALARFASHGNEIVFLKGNHDIQLYWPAVQRRILDWMRRFCAVDRLAFNPDQVRFLPWCFYIPGVLFVEHGNQYEATTAFRNLFVPLMPLDLPDGRQQLDLDVSGFLVRYITNPVERFDPLADNVRPLSRFYAYLWKKHPLVAARAFLSAATFVLMAHRKRRLWNENTIRRRYAAICRLNAAAVRAEAERCAQDSRIPSGDIAKVFHSIRTRHHQRTAWERRVWPFLRKRDNILPNAARTLRSRAEAVAALLETPCVVFGHSHCADAARFPDGTAYFNTGTWIPTFTEAIPHAPDNLQFTYVHVEKGTGQLWRWDPSRHHPEAIVFH